MSEHHRTPAHLDEEDPYESPMARQGAPKRRFPAHESDPRLAYALVHDELLLDGVARMNLATFCTTWAEPEVLKLLAESFDKNIVDKDEYPQTAELETRCVRMLADLWHSPHPNTTLGTSTTGSSEAAMLAGLAAKFRWRERRRSAGLSTGRPNFVCGPVQVCWEKFARYFDVEIREVPMDAGRYLMEPEQCLERCDENTIMVVATLGQTFTGLFEDVAAIAAALDALQAEQGLDIPLHVDGASGAMLAPFTAPDLEWDFRIPRVKSINASGHKTGLAPLGCGWAVWREAVDMPKEMIFNVNYLGGEMPTFNLNFSRPGGQVVTQYYDFIRLGREGYGRVHGATYETCRHLTREIAKLGPFEIVHDGDPLRGIAAVSWKLTDGDEHAFNLFDLADRLRAHGWLVPAYTLPPHLEDLAIQRILVRHGFSRDMADLLLGDIHRSMGTLRDHPPSTSLSEREVGSFNHNATPAVRETGVTERGSRHGGV
ncbi:MAG TPA: glutamate decarboxylase [Solirubrobacteraceae bacterium]|jgi:glutamate decarboxylase|nr:glutamate decarboxylase [Solirubrobacteraceae bacterium]